MQSFEAMQKAINGKTIEHAKSLGMSRSMVNKWQESSDSFDDSGAYNPLDRIVTVMNTSRAEGNGHERYLAPLHYLAIKFNQIVIPAPPAHKGFSELYQNLSRLSKEFGDLLSISGEKFSDGEVSPRDARAIRQEAYELQTALSAFIMKVEEAVAKD